VTGGTGICNESVGRKGGWNILGEKAVLSQEYDNMGMVIRLLLIITFLKTLFLCMASLLTVGTTDSGPGRTGSN
jgi:hypothetical protein